ncbi:MAG TPA: hypothetical protein VLA34_02445, partial [Candidatus Krumholzibacterium sp.]|nr:hypothetical protein [Candidatus Krumholzibacterium sp.]
MKRILKSKITSTISLIIGLIVTFVIIFLIVFHTDFFARRASAMLSRYFFAGTNFSLKIDNISGNPLNSLQMRGLHVRYNGPDFAYDVVRMESLSCEYDLRSVLKGKPVIDSIRLDRPHVWIKPDSSGINVIPSPVGGGG